MKTSTRFIGKLKVKDKKALNEFVKNSESHSVRSRAKAILLSSQGRTVTELAHDFQVSHNTIYSWLDRWDNDGIEGVSDKSRCGAPPKLTPSEKTIVVAILKEHPHSPKLVLVEITNRLGKTISGKTLRRIANAAGMSWKRMRKSLKSKQDKKKFKAAKREINQLVAQHQSEEIELVFF